jgi:hypothetical protein
LDVLVWRAARQFTISSKETFLRGSRPISATVRVPRLCLYTITSGTTEIKVDQEWRAGEPRGTGLTHSPSWMPEIRAHYLDMEPELARLCVTTGSKRATLTSKFVGVIPAPTRERIKEVQGAGMEVLLMAEPDWRLDLVERDPDPPRNYDPLVVGFALGRLWLIDRFDPTPLETYVAEEFAS